jgi:hypothetical protein
MKTHLAPTLLQSTAARTRRSASWNTPALWLAALPLLCLLAAFWAVVHEGVQAARLRQARAAAYESALWRCKAMRSAARTNCTTQLALAQ